jgi:phosphatidate cytidylyltransferase
MDNGADDTPSDEGDLPPEEDDTQGPPTGGVRIIGAQEASEAVARGEAGRRREEGELGFGDRPEEPGDDGRPLIRFPRPLEAKDPSSFGAVPVVRADDDEEEIDDDATATHVIPTPPSEESFELPHYSDPPTGQVPRVVIAEGDDGSDSWSGLSTGPRWRDQEQAFDDADFSDLIDDGPRLGALDEPGEGGGDFFDLGSDFDDSSGYGDTGEVIPTRRRDAARHARRRRSGGGGGGGGGGDEFDASTGRNVPLAIGVGAALFALGLLCFKLGAVTTTILVAVVLVAAAVEYFGAVRAAGYNPATLLGLVATAALAIAPFSDPVLAYPVIGAITVISGMIWYLWVSPGKGAVPDLGVTLLGIGWIGGLGSFATFMMGVARPFEKPLDMDSNPGIGILLGAVLVAVSYDVGGFFVGKYFGRTPLSEVSPNKTQEGLIGGFFVALFVPFIVLKFLPGVAPLGDSAATAFAFCLFCALFAPAGDLCQSMIKRDLGIKDMGSILPAHGGVLDRFDALLFVLPVAWFMAHILGVETVQGFVF